MEGAKLWRLDDPALVRAFDDKQLLIADGHHRYETALAFAEEERTPASAQMLAVLVSTEDPGSRSSRPTACSPSRGASKGTTAPSRR